MKITRLSLYSVDLLAWGGESRYSPAQALQAPLETNIVRLETDTGLVGWGEGCVAPPFYLPTLAEGSRAAIRYVAPLVLGADPRRPRAVREAIRGALRGDGPARAAIDMALWDLAGKVHGAPLVDLWGGRVVEDMEVLAMVSIGSVEGTLAGMARYREAGYKTFQIKIGFGGAADDIAKITGVIEGLQQGERAWFDVNRGWTVDQAMQVLPRVRHLAPLIEQPCETYAECRTLAQRLGIGLMLDEAIDGQEAMIQAVSDGVMDVAVLKMGCTGGLSEHRHLVELGLRLGIPMRIEDFYGTGLTLAAVCHLAQGVPEAANFGLYDYHLPEIPVVKNPFPVVHGRVRVPADCARGLGVEVDETVLGEAVTVMEAG
jgi:L-alanine-DL-glutamate epimerase-like enolase superfamily enzyme